jgi:hypothetical protein
VRFLRRLKAREHGPHSGHLDGMRRDVFAADLVGVVVLFVDQDFVASLVMYGMSIFTVRSRSASMNSLF